MFFRSILMALLVLIGEATPLQAAPSTCDKIKEYIFTHLNETGVLKQDRWGFVYVDLDDKYILDLNGFIADKGFDTPPYFGGADMHGAHISVIYADEAQAHKLVGKIKEVGSTIHFRVKSCTTVQPKSWKNVDEVYILTVDAPILAKLRKKYGLPPSHYDFHITIGVKYAAEKAA